MKTDLHILFICNEYPPYKHGGIGIFVKNLAEELVQHKIQCTVAGVYPDAADSNEIINGVRILRMAKKMIRFPFSSRLNNLLNERKARSQLSRLVKQLHDQYQFTAIESYDWGGPLLSKPSCPLIVRLHGSHTAHAISEGKPYSKMLAHWERRSLKIADQIVSVSHHMMTLTEKAFGHFSQPATIIYNSVNESIFFPHHEVIRDSNMILFVGKFHIRKGVYELFSILNHLLRLNPDAHFLFVGHHTTEQSDELLSIVSPDFHSRIRFKHAVDQIQLPKIYSQASLMIMPTRAEAFGLTVIEAMACGCVVAMSNLPITHEIISDEMDGLIIDPENSEMTSKRIHQLLGNPSKLNQMREAAVRKVKLSFSNEKILAQNLNLYKNLIHEA
ncbi:MAG: glycosyltransferase family 4 protein [Chitinophagaceae bacterium]|nr:glycosyltransferase family 4 protein [Chitinophagaceae bacterium]